VWAAGAGVARGAALSQGGTYSPSGTWTQRSQEKTQEAPEKTTGSPEIVAQPRQKTADGEQLMRTGSGSHSGLMQTATKECPARTFPRKAPASPLLDSKVAFHFSHSRLYFYSNVARNDKCSKQVN
jgi:hypothetical protein